MKLINYTGLRLHVGWKGPGKPDTQNSGSICGAGPFPPGKIVTVPDDIVTMEIRLRHQVDGNLDTSDEKPEERLAREDRWSGRYLDDADV